MTYGPEDTPPSGQAPVEGPAGTTTYGGLGKRFLARLLDGLIVGIPVSIVLVILPGISPGGIVGGIVSTLAAIAYYIFLETSRGATLGKHVLGLSVTGSSGGSPISTDASFRRNAWLLLGLLNGVPFIGWLAGLVSLGIVIAIAVTISSDDRNQGIHDQFANTLVVERS